MSQKLRAFQKTAGMFAIASAVPLVLYAFFQLPIVVISWILLVGVVVYFVWLVYSINLTQIQHDDTINQIEQRYNNAVSNKKV